MHLGVWGKKGVKGCWGHKGVFWGCNGVLGVKRGVWGGKGSLGGVKEKSLGGTKQVPRVPESPV